MAVEAVAHVVIQKLTDLLKEESIIGQKLVVDQLEEISKALEKMSGYLIDAENKQKENANIKNWADEYLRNVYYVEDTIETFAFRIARQRKRLGFLMNHALFLKNFTACKKLNRKIKKIRTNIKNLSQQRPSGVENASVHSTPRPHNDNEQTSRDDDLGKGTAEEDNDREKEEDDEDPKDNMPEYSKNLGRDAIQKQHTYPISQLHIARSTRRDKIGMRSRSDISVIRERCWQKMVGFKDDLRDLVDELTNKGRGAHRIISIFGEMGSGKTTLTQAVLATKTIEDSFKSCCARVNVSKDSTTEEILLKLLKQVGNSKDRDQGGVLDEQMLKTRLMERLNDKRYLIVLDDVGASDVWERLRDAFPDNKSGSKIIITTCDAKVAAKCAYKRIIVKRLSHEESEELFLRKAAVEQVPEDLKQKILKICDGLPLNIVLLGSLLSAKKENHYDQWSEILSRQPNWRTSDILALSYNDLPGDLKLCMLYMVLFPKEYDIPVRRLLRLWLAEGFVKLPVPDDKEIPEEPDDKEIPEDVAQQYFDNLFQRSLIQISKQRSDGNHRKKCRLIGVLHDFLSSKALDINLFHVACEPAASFGARPPPDPSELKCARRLVEHVDSKNSPPNPSELKWVRSYLSFNFQKKDIPAKGVGTLLSKMMSNGFRLLRVLDLEGVYKPSLPDNLGDFFHLRYLGLRWTFLDTLPSSVGELTYLETLDIKHTHVNSLPNSIWKLKHLRHLNLNEMRLDMPVAPPSSLPRLLTLWGLSIADSGCLVKNGLNKLLYLRELGITFHLSNCEDLLDWVSKLTSLRQLMLRSVDDTGRPSKLSLKPFSELDQLSNMDLLGYLPKLPDEVHFPQNIKVLSLSVSQLKEDPMPTLGKLKKLTVLRLLANSYLGEKIVCPRGGFEELRVLKLWMLQNLEEWELEEGAMKKLEELNIRCCYRLKSIPSGLLPQGTLKELTLTNMPKPFTEKVEQLKSMRVSLIVKDYKFTPLPWEQGDDSFNGMHSMATNANGC